MKRILAMVAVFGIAAVAAAYIASSPHSITGGPFATLDAAAASLVAIAGRSGAVLGLLTLGGVLSLLAFMALGDGTASQPTTKASRPGKRRQDQADAAPGPVWTPEPLSSEERIASLRRRTASETGRAPPAPTNGPPPRPVILVRKPRDRARDWFDDRSWLGGLPRLGQAEWPRDASGTPLPFAAQIDLAELANACPENPLPRTGSLAFFLGTGTVLHLPDGEQSFAEVPDDLPAAFDEGGYPFPAKPTRLSRPFFPFWPVEPVALDLPAALRDHHNPALGKAIEDAAASLLAQYATPRSTAFSAEDGGPADPALWWHGINHLADQLHSALDGAGRLVMLRRDSLQQAEAALASIEANGDPDGHRIDAAREEVARRQAALAAMEAQRDGLPDMIAAIDQFVTGRDTWQQLDDEEYAVIADFLAELHASYGDVTQHHAPHSAGELATLSLRTMITDTSEALDAMPEEQLERINHAYRLPVMVQHQMFGLPGGKATSHGEHGGDILLLQLAYDDMMEWRWSDVGLFQFWISPEALTVGRWDAVQLTFGSA
ncbi:DUF1963 domain-containing protein [Novosphingobium album (ex Hu et al. 2023)]|uniref:DUF1963 domain-containing protein n=1 Tax=Novosphingobium album (ex Hu et al. 2023) TaxID=2930093 RepID=A0ABT0AZH9_9SPHN|nr:DUF1963 domain-containing protein [Novosphingobium album (ex Hu et al. 2023)]MCJ2178104.1 DUF1963 domain-containing protein [Novosphingobium album (ex Hu et al. 2023)]